MACAQSTLSVGRAEHCGKLRHAPAKRVNDTTCRTRRIQCERVFTLLIALFSLGLCSLSLVTGVRTAYIALTLITVAVFSSHPTRTVLVKL